MNQILVISPYWLDSAKTWVFDDKLNGLSQEPFVAGVPEMIDNLAEDIVDAKKGFRLTFSHSPFPGFQTKLKFVKEEYDGNWYFSEKFNLIGWLCPALFRYFTKAPEEIYVKAEPMNSHRQYNR